MYDSAAGTLKLITAGNQERNCNPNDLSLLSKEGASIVVELKFVEVFTLLPLLKEIPYMTKYLTLGQVKLSG